MLEEIVARAAGSAQEVCGLLLGHPTQVVDAVHCSNVAADPAIAFEIDPGALIAAYKRARAGGPAIVGCYHSHPGGPPEPSARDAADAAANGWLWLIVGRGAPGLFRAIDGGEYHGKFAAVPLASPFDKPPATR